jgi:deazaflavin-dependent oxidoreductase (nitroreductase family)
VPIPPVVARFNKVVTNRLTRLLVGHGDFAELEHVGRRSGRTYRIPINAFRSGDVVTFALTYGPHTDWLRNVRAAGGARLLCRGELLTLGAPREVPTEVGMSRMPGPARWLLPRIGVDRFVEMPVLTAVPVG